MSANYGPQAKCGPPPVSTDKVLLECSKPIYLHTVRDRFHMTVAELKYHNSEETGTLARGCARAIVGQSEEQKQPGPVMASWDEMREGGGRK